MFRVAKATFVRNTLVMMRAYPWSFVIGHILSGVYTVLFAYFAYHYVFAGQLDGRFLHLTGTDDYLSYAILGGAFYAFAVSTLMNVSRSLITELREGTLEAVLLTPSLRRGYFLGNVAQQLMRTVFEFSVIVIVGALFGLTLVHAHIGSAIVVWLLSTGAFFCQALVLGSLMLRFRDTYITQNTLFVIMAFVSGVTFPIPYLPEWLQPLGAIMPLAPALDAFRQCVIQGKPLIAVSPQLFHMAALSLVYLAIGVWGMRRMEKRVVESIFG
ncbi:ABC transporter [Brevibacillus agri]|uniref:Transport permease protein n=1 Tax=Brevibacillus agri TaxID=51101 RepID=A0A3M8AN18_9BACL|nr:MULTISPECIES: ABC transporter permease [Brevibacillus]EJL47512.1 ABC-type polysaccharide/polyol phosphate export system, permease component [Brevibacillus sp. CF112]MBG9566600.1 ABC transporter [Brevibacillus agri]MBY0054180.1 ABC transporter permease [Brevibacillus agri]MCG5252005.1 ABC transporter permease [Brevibacillus agri]MED1643959.1 ABC transporter permease [Brevibacillus agri]